MLPAKMPGLDLGKRVTTVCEYRLQSSLDHVSSGLKKKRKRKEPLSLSGIFTLVSKLL